MPPVESQPSEIRAKVLAEHRALMTLLDDLEAALLRNQPIDEQRVRLLAKALAMLLEHHASDEDRQLVPVLQSIDAWGPARVEHLRAEHVSELEGATRLREDATRASPSRDRLLALLSALRDQLQREERESLGADVLRNDVIVVGQFSG